MFVKNNKKTQIVREDPRLPINKIKSYFKTFRKCEISTLNIKKRDAKCRNDEKNNLTFA